MYNYFFQLKRNSGKTPASKLAFGMSLAVRAEFVALDKLTVIVLAVQVSRSLGKAGSRLASHVTNDLIVKQEAVLPTSKHVYCQLLSARRYLAITYALRRLQCFGQNITNLFDRVSKRMMYR